MYAKYMYQIKSKNKKGYTLLFAVLTAALVLGVAAFILGIARKQYILSSTSRDSAFAFYAADSGIECVANQKDILSADTEGSYNINCSRNVVENISFTENGNVRTAIFTLGFAKPESNPTNQSLNVRDRWGCAEVTITHKTNGSKSITETVSRGYNICTYDNEQKTFSPDNSSRTVERALVWTIYR